MEVLIIKFYFLFFLSLIFSSIILGYFKINSIILNLFIIVSIILVLVRAYYPLLFSINIDQIESFLIKNKKNPLLHFIYATANHIDEEAEESYIKLLIKFQNPKRQAIYKTEYALYKKAIHEANANVHMIEHFDYKLYYQSLIAILEGDLNRARLNSVKLKSIWMKSVILAEISLKENNIEKAKDYAFEAVVKTRGVQRYSIYKNFEFLIGIEDYAENVLISKMKS